MSGIPKQKSIKSKAINKNSKRKVNVFGKKQKKRYAAEVVLYMSRAQTLQKADSLSRITGNARFEVNDVYLHLYS